MIDYRLLFNKPLTDNPLLSVIQQLIK